MSTRFRSQLFRAWLLIMLCTAALGACSGGGDASGDPDGSLADVADAVGDQSTATDPGPAPDYGQPISQSVGPSGGTVEGPGAVTVQVPANAVAEDTEIEVAVVEDPPAPSAFDPTGPVVGFGPSGTTFATPVLVTLPYDEAAAGGREADVRVWWAETLEGPWVELASVVDTTANVVSAEVTHFSYGAAGLVACASHCGGSECGDDGCGGSCGTCPNADDACLEGACVPQGTPTPGPVWAHLGKDDLYFDFEGGAATNDPTRGDLGFEHSLLMGEWWVSNLVMTGAFLDPDTEGVRDFGLFATVTSAAGYDLQDHSFAPEKGFVYVLETNLGKLAKLQVMDTNFRLGDEGAPSVDFIYMYDNFVDTVAPAPRFVRILENKYDPSSGVQVELARVDFATANPEVVVSAPPSHVEIHFNEALTLPPDGDPGLDRGVLEVVRVDEAGFSAALKFRAFSGDHFNRAYGIIADESFQMITEPGTYELRAAPLQEGQTGYFADYAGNELATWPGTIRFVYQP